MKMCLRPHWRSLLSHIEMIKNQLNILAQLLEWKSITLLMPSALGADNSFSKCCSTRVLVFASSKERFEYEISFTGHQLYFHWRNKSKNENAWSERERDYMTMRKYNNGIHLWSPARVWNVFVERAQAWMEKNTWWCFSSESSIVLWNVLKLF